MTTIRLIVLSIFSALILAFSSISLAAEPVSKSNLGGVAIDGHDSCAYHGEQTATEHKAQKGTKYFTVKYKGAKWQFTSQQNADAFRANPEKYSPAYNGHCANALSLGEGLIKTDGTHWQIFGDQLFLFYAARSRDRWLDGNHQTYKIEADIAWQQIVGH